MNQNLIDYINNQTVIVQESTDKTADLVFFKIEIKEDTSAETLSNLIDTHTELNYDLSLESNTEYSYISLGAWLGDQGLALKFIGMCSLLKLGDLLTLYTIFGDAVPKEMVSQLAGQGLVSIVFKTTTGYKVWGNKTNHNCNTSAVSTLMTQELIRRLSNGN